MHTASTGDGRGSRSALMSAEGLDHDGNVTHETGKDGPDGDRLRIVIVIASKHGSTIAIAGAIAQAMSSQGATVVVCQPDDDVDLDDVDAVVIGSAVYLGRWMHSARRFIKRRAPELHTKKVWLFSSGPVAEEPERGLENGELDRLLAQSGATGHREFGGRLDMATLGPIETLIATGVGVTDGDHRDWSEIRVWAESILSALRDAAVQGAT